MLNINNDGITREQIEKLVALRGNIQYAVKKEKALEQLKSGNKSIAEIVRDTGVLEVDVLKLRRVLQSRNIAMLGKRTNSTDDGQVI